MGNRAVITSKDREMAVYLHWNGGRDTIEPLLKYCELQGYRGFGYDDSYAMARLCQVMSNFFGGTLSVGVTPYTEDKDMDPGDNGIYIVKGWEIVDRLTVEYDDNFKRANVRKVKPYEEQQVYDFTDMLLKFDRRMPEKCRLGAGYILSKVVDASTLKLGDEVYWRKISESTPEIFHVVAFDEKNSPCIDLYDHDGDWTWNPNNKLEGLVRIPSKKESE